LSPKKLWMFFVCQQKFSEKHNFFFDRLKRLLVVQILDVTVYQENAEHIRLITLHWQSDKVEMGGTCLGSQNRYSKKLYWTLANCATTQRTPLQGIVSRDFPRFEGMKIELYYTEDTFTRNCVQGFSDIRRNENWIILCAWIILSNIRRWTRLWSRAVSHHWSTMDSARWQFDGTLRMVPHLHSMGGPFPRTSQWAMLKDLWNGISWNFH